MSNIGQHDNWEQNACCLLSHARRESKHPNPVANQAGSSQRGQGKQELRQPAAIDSHFPLDLVEGETEAAKPRCQGIK